MQIACWWLPGKCSVSEVIYLVFIALLQNKLTPALPQLSLSHNIRMQHFAKYLIQRCHAWISQRVICRERYYFRVSPTSVRPCDGMKLFIATAWTPEVVVVVHFSHSTACLLENKKVAVIFAGKIQVHDSDISCPSLQGMLEMLWEVWTPLCSSPGC